MDDQGPHGQRFFVTEDSEDELIIIQPNRLQEHVTGYTPTMSTEKRCFLAQTFRKSERYTKLLLLLVVHYVGDYTAPFSFLRIIVIHELGILIT